MKFRTNKYIFKLYNGDKKISIYSTSDEIAQYLISIENTNNVQQWILYDKKKTFIEFDPYIYEKSQESVLIKKLQKRITKK